MADALARWTEWGILMMRVHCGLTLTLIAMEIWRFVLDGCAIQGGL